MGGSGAGARDTHRPGYPGTSPHPVPDIHPDRPARQRFWRWWIAHITPGFFERSERLVVGLEYSSAGWDFWLHFMETPKGEFDMRLLRISLIIAAFALVLLLSACLGEAALPPLESGEISARPQPALNPTLAAAQNIELFLGGQMLVSSQIVPQIPHDLIGRSDCLMCHKQGVSAAPRIPDSHRGLESNTCITCHTAPTSAELSGAEMYTRVCVRCHGENGEGSYGPALNAKSYLQSVTDEQIREAIARGRGESEMLSWGDLGLLTERQIDELVAFIRAWEATAPQLGSTTAAEPANASLGDSTQGEDLFAQFCSGCHGIQGEASIGENFVLQGFVGTTDDETIALTIRDGAPGMPSFHALLTSDNINDILAFVRSW